MQRPNLPKEEPAIPIEADIAKARATYLRDMVTIVKDLKEKGNLLKRLQLQQENLQSNTQPSLKCLIRMCMMKQL